MARIGRSKGDNSGDAPGGARPSNPARQVRPQANTAKVAKAGTVTKSIQAGKATRFFGEVVSEMRKVSWPNRTQLMQASGVVIGFVIVLTAYLWGVDALASRLIDRIF